MPDRLKDRVALITGGGGGIGRACALRFASEGALVCAVDLDADLAAETARDVEAAGGRALSFALDVTNEGENNEAVTRCVEAFGALDVLVAAAGVGSIRAEPQQALFSVMTTPTDMIRRVLEVNLWGVLFSDRAAARWMLDRHRSGSIINLASIMSRMPSVGGTYNISKAAVWMLTKSLALELATSGIRVNAIGPGWIDTPMTAPLQEDDSWMANVLAHTPMQRLGRATEVADAAVFLASDESSYFTGEMLHPAGGVFLG
jgi:NAD(P)-dependent dehydrogenase (short-subunit alcohol dehydrogenase family)